MLELHWWIRVRCRIRIVSFYPFNNNIPYIFRGPQWAIFGLINVLSFLSSFTSSVYICILMCLLCVCCWYNLINMKWKKQFNMEKRLECPTRGKWDTCYIYFVLESQVGLKNTNLSLFCYRYTNTYANASVEICMYTVAPAHFSKYPHRYSNFNCSSAIDSASYFV